MQYYDVMAKKSLTAPSEDRSRFELRMPAGLKAQLEGLSEDAGVSLNSLICSMLYGLAKHANVGSVSEGPFGYYTDRHPERPKPEPIWFGHEFDPDEAYFGTVWFQVDLNPANQAMRPPLRVTERDIS